MFSDDATAERWFEKQRWPHGPVCPNCGSMRATCTTHPAMSLRRKDCRKFFSVRRGTVVKSTKRGLYRKVTVFGLLGFLDRRNEAFRQVLRRCVDLQHTHLWATALAFLRLDLFRHGVNAPLTGRYAKKDKPCTKQSQTRVQCLATSPMPLKKAALVVIFRLAVSSYLRKRRFADRSRLTVLFMGMSHPAPNSAAQP